MIERQRREVSRALSSQNGRQARARERERGWRLEVLTRVDHGCEKKRNVGRARRLRLLRKLVALRPCLITLSSETVAAALVALDYVCGCKVDSGVLVLSWFFDADLARSTALASCIPILSSTILILIRPTLDASPNEVCTVATKQPIVVATLPLKSNGEQRDLRHRQPFLRRRSRHQSDTPLTSANGPDDLRQL